MYVAIHSVYIVWYVIGCFKPHRVLIPVDEAKRQVVRQSIAFFGHPDSKCVIKCINGSNKYAPITAEDDLAERFARTY